jgi:hypothetical protein
MGVLQRKSMVERILLIDNTCPWQKARKKIKYYKRTHSQNSSPLPCLFPSIPTSFPKDNLIIRAFLVSFTEMSL